MCFKTASFFSSRSSGNAHIIEESDYWYHCPEQNRNLHDSGMELFKEEIHKMNADSTITQITCSNSELCSKWKILLLVLVKILHYSLRCAMTNVFHYQQNLLEQKIKCWAFFPSNFGGVNTFCWRNKNSTWAKFLEFSPAFYHFGTAMIQIHAGRVTQVPFNDSCLQPALSAS